MKTQRQTSTIITGILCGTCCAAFAGEPKTTTAATKSEASAFDELWGLATLYKNESNPLIQELRFTGRIQVDFFGVDAEQGEDSDLVNRRTRFGLKAKMFEDFTAHVEMDANIERGESFYNRLTDAYVAWEPSKEMKLTLGKHGVPFTYDGWTSSKELLSIDRSAIGNNIWDPEEYMPGVSVSGKKDNWLYRVGVFSNGSTSPEFGDFDATWLADFGIGYDFSDALAADKAILRLDYVYQDPTSEATFTRANENVLSLNGEYQQGAFGLAADLAGSTGFGGQSDLFGLMIMPSYYLIDKKLQAVLRYTYMNSEDDNGIRLGRYERNVVFGRGDEYQEVFAGLNYYIYGHKLKIQGGVQYTVMEDNTNTGGDYDGWQGVMGLRIAW